MQDRFFMVSLCDSEVREYQSVHNMIQNNIQHEINLFCLYPY